MRCSVPTGSDAPTPVTEAGFVRISSNPSAIADAVRPSEALDALRCVRDRLGHRFLADDVQLLVGDPRRGLSTGPAASRIQAML